MIDYGRHTPKPPTAATRDRLTEEIAAAPPRSAKHRVACDALVNHLLAEGGYKREFSTPSGRTFTVRVSDPDELSPEVRQWLGGRDFVKVVMGHLRDGTAVPDVVAALINLTVREKK